ncbi:MFS transporter [Sphingorhabdus soli]|uniref:MFS transporter n=1 Tax=Flavisphingopyxis soli TaxID=2601267 RepID=A0A5C6UPM4_9SPHN|nr:MFS transporter [Sphingorhabdus soli]TXC74096.1 MFS transporter [Sphingorhabdus soli]
MQTSLVLLKRRHFGPLFATQFLNAFNDNLFKMAMVVLVTYTIYSNPATEAQFNALASGLFILPFFLFSALAGQIADSSDKARVIRFIKSAEIGIMIVGSVGIYFELVPVMLAALFAMGVHSTFFGPIKYAILPQHLEPENVLGGTGLVEAGTYLAILSGTVVGGIIPPAWAAIAVILVAIVGRLTASAVPYAPPEADAPPLKLDWHLIRNSWNLVSGTMHIPRLFLAIMSISFFWAIGAVIIAIFPPLVKNLLGADESVATVFTAVFSVGVALGSIAINRMLKGKVSAKFAPASVIVMGLFIVDLWYSVGHWGPVGGQLIDWRDFLSLAKGDRVFIDLLGISVAGGMFVVPLYAFLTTTVAKSMTARTIAANNIVNSAFMVLGTLIYGTLVYFGVTIDDTLLFVAAACLVSAWLAQKLHRACD